MDAETASSATPPWGLSDLLASAQEKIRRILQGPPRDWRMARISETPGQGSTAWTLEMEDAKGNPAGSDTVWVGEGERTARRDAGAGSLPEWRSRTRAGGWGTLSEGLEVGK